MREMRSLSFGSALAAPSNCFVGGGVAGVEASDRRYRRRSWRALDGDDGIGGRVGNDPLAGDMELGLRLGLSSMVKLLVGGDVARAESNVVAGGVGGRSMVICLSTGI